jgi:hypothetical protein
MPRAARSLAGIAFAVWVLVPRLAWTQGPLGPEFQVNTLTPPSQLHPAVASDAAGNFIVVWHSPPPDPARSAVLHPFGVFGQRFASSGVPLGLEFRVNTYTTDGAALADVASDASGNFVVLWTSYNDDDPSYGIFGQRFAASGAPLGAEFRVNTYTPGFQSNPSVSADPSGNFVVLWNSNDQDGSGFGVFGQRFAGTGAPLGQQFRVNTYTTGYQWFSSVASDPAGNFIVVWRSNEQDGSLAGVFGQRFDSGGAPLGPEFRVNTYTTSSQSVASTGSAVTIDAAGDFIVVWFSTNQDGSDGGIYGQRFASTGAPAGPEFRVNSYTTGAQLLSAIAGDGSGNFVVAWASLAEDGSLYGIFGQRFASAGAPLGPEFRINTFTTNEQFRPSVAADAAGNFVVVWDSYAQDGSSYGIFGQRYRQIVPVDLMRFGVE